MLNLSKSPEIQAAVLAKTFAQELRLPLGNLWEPGLARKITKQLAEGKTLEEIEADYRLRFGMKKKGTKA